MTRARPSQGFDSRRGWRGLPYLALAIGLVFATAPTWWMMVFGVEVELDLLLRLRCTAWSSF